MKHWILMLALAATIGCEPQEKKKMDTPPATPPAAPADEPAADEPADEDGAALPGDNAATLVSFNAADNAVVEFKAPGMHCKMCAAEVVKALKETKGVVDVKADPETKVVEVAIDEAEFDRNDAVAAINSTGFGESTDEAESI